MRKSILTISILFCNMGAYPQVSPLPIKLFFEKTYLHTDRELYAGGEDIWFKAYLLNGQTNELATTSNNLYMELISPEAKIIEHQLIRLENGLGKGDFHLGDSIPEGNYRIRAYTNWMRNFGDKFVFEKSIRVVQSIQAAAKPVTAANKKTKATQPTVPNAAPAPLPIPTYSLRFFPEGGSLPEGVAGMVAFKAEDKQGRAIAIKGEITSLEGDLLTEFSCDSTGAGKVYLDQAEDKKYTASGSWPDGTPFSLHLPLAVKQGFSIFVGTTDSLVKVTVSTNAASLAAQQGKQIILVGKYKAKVVYAATTTLKDLQFGITIPRQSLPGGITALTLYDGMGKPQCERLIYNRGKEQVKLQINTDKTGYGPKEKTTVTILATDPDNRPVRANLSIAVTDAAMTGENESNIAAYLQLSSEIRGPIPHAARYLDPKNPKAAEQLDLLLLTQGWRDFLWKRLADSVIKKLSYPVEQGITVSGRLREIWRNKGIPKGNITLNAWGNEDQKLFTAKTDSAGKFVFDYLNFTGSQRLNFTSRDAKGKKAGYIVIDTATTATLYPVYPQRSPAPDTTAKATSQPELLLSRQAAMKRLSLSDTLELNAVTISRQRGRTISDTLFTITRADFEFKYLRDYMLARLPGAMMYDRDPQYVIFMGILPVPPEALAFSGRWMAIGPTFSTTGINGKRVTQKDYYKINWRRDFLGLPMDKINSVRLVHNRNRDGIMEGWDGILGDHFDIFLDLKPNAFDRQGFQALNMDMDGYAEAREFYAPQYAVSSTKRDLRTTIHWEPSISTDEKGEATFTYYNADPKTKVRIVAEGIATGGVPVVATVLYQVK